MIKECIIFAVGAAIGAGATVLIMRKRYDKKYNELLKDAINSDADFRLREAERKLAEVKARESGYIQSSGEEKPADDNEKKDLQKVDSIDPSKLTDGDGAAKENKIGKTNYVDYTTYYEKKVANEYPREEYDAAMDSAKYEGKKLNDEYHSGKKPKLITREEFYSPEYEHHNKSTLYYYKDDEILATEDDEIIREPEKYIGDALDKFGFRNNNEEVIYVRNFDWECDYEIDKIEGAYTENKWSD